MGKNNVMGRAGGALPLYACPVQGSDAPNEVQTGESPTYPKFDGTTVSYGYVRDAQ